jgi:hypothetical protein
MGIECYVDADSAGGWNITTSADADNIMSHTGFVITVLSTGLVVFRQK